MSKLIKCIVCNKSHFDLLKNYKSFQFLQCKNCRLLFIHPLPIDIIDNKKRVDFFSKYNWAGKNKDSFDAQLISAKKKLLLRLSFIKKFCHTEINKVLEVGAGIGAWSKAFKELGIKYLGVDIDRTAVEAGKQFGANLIHADFLSNNFPQTIGKNFDMVFASQVFEHISRPHIFMERSRILLREGGIIYLDIPYPYGLIPTIKKYNLFRKNKLYEADYCYLQPPWHYIAYPDYTVKYILMLHNFELIHLSHPGIYHPIFGQLDNHSKLSEIIDYIIGLFYRGNLSLIIAKKVDN